MIEKDAYNDNSFYDAESDIVDEFNHKKHLGGLLFIKGEETTQMIGRYVRAVILRAEENVLFSALSRKQQLCNTLRLNCYYLILFHNFFIVL